MLVLKPTDELTREGWLIDQNKKETRDENIGIGSGQLQECGVYLRAGFFKPQIQDRSDDAKSLARFAGGGRTGSSSDRDLSGTTWRPANEHLKPILKLVPS